MVHRTSVTVRWSELDPYQHVNHAVYLTYFEQARIEALAAIGFSMADLERAGCQIVVSEAAVKFLASAGDGEVLDVETEVLTVRRASTTWRQRIIRGDATLVTMELTGAITDLAGKPRRLPAGFAEALASMEGVP
ncbi:MAG: acyl-CoA thioesterase [Acidimicrobiia bacterium]|nr:acyl-CoA thioesterase [Acidimicrobiia bacterium]